MPSRFVKQPNGLYALFSTVVDDFTAYGMTRGEALREARNMVGVGKIEAQEKLLAADIDKEGRWQEALETIQAIHGKPTREKRVKEILGDETEENVPVGS